MEKEIESKLDSFEIGIGLPQNMLPGDSEEYTKYLNMDISILEKLTIEQCAEISYRLNQFALYIQRCLNREKATVRSLNSRIKNIIGPKINQYSGGGWDLQRASAIQDDDAARELEKQLTFTEQKCDRLEFVATGIKNQSDAMKNMQFAKRSINV